MAQDTRELLLKAALSIFAEKGFAGATVKDLADNAGVNVSLVSYHFGGKEGLFRSCMESLGKDRLNVARRLLQPPSSKEEFRVRLRVFVEEVFTFHLENPEITQILHREADMTTISHDIFAETFLKVFETLVAFFQTASERKVLRKAVNPTTAASLFFSGVIQIAKHDEITERYFGLSIKSREYRERIIDEALDFCMHGCIEEGVK